MLCVQRLVKINGDAAMTPPPQFYLDPQTDNITHMHTRLSMPAEGGIELFAMTETFCRSQSRNQSGKKK